MPSNKICFYPRPWHVLAIVSMQTLSLFASAVTSNEVDNSSAYTAVGAERAGNRSNTIPRFEPNKLVIPENWQPGEHYSDPFSQDLPLFNIDQSNVETYQAFLAEGQQQLLKANEHHRLPVFVSRRTADYPDFILESTRYNRTHTRLAPHGNGLIAYRQGFPFPSLDSNEQTAALQALWNHMTRYRGCHVERTVLQATVFANGSYTPIKLYQRFSEASAWTHAENTTQSNLLFYYLDRIVSPARLSGTSILVHETLNQSRELRRVWLYNEAHRRVRRAPSAVFDTPMPGSYGMKTADSHDMFNGSPEKYHWRYLGKKELYVPYNAYRLASKELRYQDLLQARTVNANHTRWELHRVHKIEGTLKGKHRHIYGKRTLYLDEDSWSIVLAELYDNKGQLWRISEGHMINYYDQKLPFYAMEVIYDLINQRYMVFGLSNEEPSSYTFDKTFRPSDYSPAALRRNARK